MKFTSVGNIKLYRERQIWRVLKSRRRIKRVKCKIRVSRRKELSNINLCPYVKIREHGDQEAKLQF